MPHPTLREQLFQDQKRLMGRCSLMLMLRPYMNDRGVDKKVLRAMDKEIERLGLLIKGYGWASCCIPPTPPAGE
ncbi:hypothetical protein ES707_09599 [subsurface metagenome]